MDSNGTRLSQVDLQAQLDRAFELMSAGRFDDAAAVAREAGEALPADPATAAQVRLLLGLHGLLQGRFEAGLAQALPALGELEGMAHEARPLAWAYSCVGFCMGSLGDPAGGLEYAARAIALAEASGRPLDLMRAHSDRGCLLGMLDEHAASLQSLQSALALARASDIAFAVAQTLNNLAYTELQLAPQDPTAPARAAEWAREALSVAERIGHGRSRVWARNHLGQALLGLGRADEAMPLLEAAEAEASDPAQRLEVLRSLARLRVVEGQPAQARALLAEAQALGQAQGQEPALLRVLADALELERETGATAAALDLALLRNERLEAHYKRRLRIVGRSAELFADAERARLQASLARQEASLLARSVQRWQDQALQDALTGVANRRGFERRAEALLGSGSDLVLLVFDVDHFKRINDGFGHPIGDVVLVTLARIVSGLCRAGDCLARVGGEEFALLLPGADGAIGSRLAERVRSQAAGHDWAALAPDLQVRLSLGVAMARPGETLAGLMARADAALYAAKRGGRNQVVVAEA